MYVSMSRLRVRPGRPDELVRALRGRGGLVEPHDTQHLLNRAVDDVEGLADLEHQVGRPVSHS
jgi:hypothetical protein